MLGLTREAYAQHLLQWSASLEAWGRGDSVSNLGIGASGKREPSAEPETGLAGLCPA